MADRKLEKLMLEALKHLVDQDNLGIVKNGVDPEMENHTQFQWQDINDSFALKMKDSNFFDSLCAAFYKVHTGRWICDHTFSKALSDELHSMGIPEEDINNAKKAVEELNKKYTKDGYNNEAAVGWGDQAGYKKVSQEFGNKKVSDGETYEGENEPPFGVEPKHTRPVPSKA